ncbi:MAG: deoxynucleoside kinase [bacterium]|nr:deoxynucleoside kinase [bacterium]
MANEYPNLYVSISGVMGSGKTTATKLLADHLELHLFEEDADRNTFLPLYYNDPRRWALHSQLFYLREKFAQLAKIKLLLEHTPVVQDSPLYQDYHTYTKAQHTLGNMDEAEFELYERFFHTLHDHAPVPDLIVQLDASADSLMRRIHERARGYELAVEHAYVALLARLQEQWIENHGHLNIFRIDTNDLDLVRNRAHQQQFIEAVKDRMTLIAARRQEPLPLEPLSKISAVT